MSDSSSLAAVALPSSTGSGTGGGLSPAPGAQGGVPLWRSGSVLVLAALIQLAYWFNPPLDIQPQAGVVMQLPLLLGPYDSEPGKITQAELDILPKDTEFARRVYTDSKGHQITCSIVLSGAEQRSIHRPEGCLEGQGWTIIDQKYIPVPLDSGHKMEGRQLLLERRVTDRNGQPFRLRAFYVYWFVGQNVTTASEVHRVLLNNWDRAVLNIAHRWAYVSVFSLITGNIRPDGLDADATSSLLTDFARQIVPTFQISEMPAKPTP
jgi:hypothetical protein